MRAAITPEQILARIVTSDHAALILRRLCAYHPKLVSRKNLMEGAGITVEHEGPISAYASFHWYVERVNDQLRPFGWAVSGSPINEMYYLERC